MRINQLCLLAVALAFLVLAGCSDSGQGVVEINHSEYIFYDDRIDETDFSWPDTELPRALVSYWETIAQGDPEQAFKLELPYFQQVVKPGAYRNYLNLYGPLDSLDHIKVVTLEKISDYKYVVGMEVHLKRPDGTLYRSNQRDNWVKVDGTWYHLIRNSLVFPGIG